MPQILLLDLPAELLQHIAGYMPRAYVTCGADVQVVSVVARNAFKVRPFDGEVDARWGGWAPRRRDFPHDQDVRERPMTVSSAARVAGSSSCGATARTSAPSSSSKYSTKISTRSPSRSPARPTRPSSSSTSTAASCAPHPPHTPGVLPGAAARRPASSAAAPTRPSASSSTASATRVGSRMCCRLASRRPRTRRFASDLLNREPIAHYCYLKIRNKP